MVMIKKMMRIRKKMMMKRKMKMMMRKMKIKMKMMMINQITKDLAQKKISKLTKHQVNNNEAEC